jgi:hypothetical protein
MDYTFTHSQYSTRGWLLNYHVGLKFLDLNARRSFYYPMESLNVSLAYLFKLNKKARSKGVNNDRF